MWYIFKHPYCYFQYILDSLVKSSPAPKVNNKETSATLTDAGLVSLLLNLSMHLSIEFEYAFVHWVLRHKKWSLSLISLETADMFTFTKEILNVKLHVLGIVYYLYIYKFVSAKK